MNYGRFPHLLQLRGPQVMFHPDQDAGAGGGAEGGEGDGGAEGADADAGAGDGGTDGDGSGEGEGGGGEGDAEAAAAAAAAGDTPVPPKRVPWQTKRIDTLTAQKTDAETRAAAAEARAAAAEARLALGGDESTSPPPPPPPAPNGERTFTQADVQAEARKIANTTALNEKIDVIHDAAVALDPDYASRVPALRQAHGDALAAKPAFFQALVKLDNGPAVWNALTKDLDHMGELLDLEPVELALELAKMDTKAGKPKEAQISASGSERKPIKPIESAAGAEVALDDPKLPMSEFAATRAKQRKARDEANSW